MPIQGAILTRGMLNTRLVCLGLNHRTAPVALRERLSLDEQGVSTALASGMKAGRPSPFDEMVLLSTCNRIEIYAITPGEGFQDLELFLSRSCHVLPAELDPHLYRLAGLDAVRHLLHVAAGLDSPMLGEPQILGQVARALELARLQAAAGPILTRLFHQAVHAGKRARAETVITRRPASRPALIATLAEEFTLRLTNVQAVILGAGEMAEITMEALRKRGAEKVLVLNRDPDRAQRLADRWNAEAGPIRDLASGIRRADILIASMAASKALVSARAVSEAMSRRPDRPLLVIDWAVPRNIDPAAAHVPGVRLYDIDDLNQRLYAERSGREQEVPKVEVLLAEEETQWLEFQRSREVAPLIVDLRRKAEAIRRGELQKTLRRLPGLSEAEQARIDNLTQAIVNKILHAPIARLKESAGRSEASEYAALAGELFDIGSSLPAEHHDPALDFQLDRTGEDSQI